MSTKTTIVKLTCKVNSDCSFEIIDGVLTLSFEQECSIDENGDTDEQMGELQSNMLWECFESSLKIVKVEHSKHVENIYGSLLAFESPFPITFDELIEWDNQQSIVPLTDISISYETNPTWVGLTPKWSHDLNDIVQSELFEDLCDYFAEKQQTITPNKIFGEKEYATINK